MGKNGKSFQLNRGRKDFLFYIALTVLAFLIFRFVGSSEPVLFDDSGAYLRVERIEGVMPVYPIFLLLNQWLFGDGIYLQVVITEQAALAAVCVVAFIRTIRREFDLCRPEAVLAFLLSLLPFTTEMPGSMATQQILTEGLAYSLFYLFMLVLLKAIWEKKPAWLAGAFGMVVVPALVRSQLQILFGVCGIIFVYIACTPGKRTGKVPFWVRFAVGIAGCLCIGIVGIFGVSKMTAAYKDMITADGKFPAGEKFPEFVMKVQCPEEYEAYLAQGGALGMPSDVASETVSEEEPGETEPEELVNRWFATSQYVSLIFSRGMYEADLQDAYLFDDEVLRGLYLELYEAADEEKQRYAYASNGLWMWQDIVGGIGRVGKTCLMIPSEYYVANYPDLIKSEDFSDIRNSHLKTIGTALIKAHFGRFLYHTMMLLPQAFICTVFFQIRPIYLLCHLVTLFLYVSALGLMIWGYADRRVKNKAAECMALVLGTNVVMIVLISIVFFGQQRYLVYNFGIFYIVYYLLLRELWNIRLRQKVRQWVTVKKRKENGGEGGHGK